jgi:hypothetical protein
MSTLQDFIVSRVRVKLMKIFLSNPSEMYYVRQLTRKTKEEINAIRRELQRMQEIGFVSSEKRGNRLYYLSNKNYDFYPELLILVAKTTGLGKLIRKNKNKIGKVKFAMMSGKFARKLPRMRDQVDLLLVGTIILKELAKIVSIEEAKLKREINYTVMTLEEFQFRKARRDPFLLGILNQPRIMLIGDEVELLSEKHTDTD